MAAANSAEILSEAGGGGAVRVCENDGNANNRMQRGRKIEYQGGRRDGETFGVIEAG